MLCACFMRADSDRAGLRVRYLHCMRGRSLALLTSSGNQVWGREGCGKRRRGRSFFFSFCTIRHCRLPKVSRVHHSGAHKTFSKPVNVEATTAYSRLYHSFVLSFLYLCIYFLVYLPFCILHFDHVSLYLRGMPPRRGKHENTKCRVKYRNWLPTFTGLDSHRASWLWATICNSSPHPSSDTEQEGHENMVEKRRVSLFHTG